MGEFGKITRAIKNEKLTKWQCEKVAHKDKEMIRTAFEADNAMKENLQSTTGLIPILVGYGLYSVEEGVQIAKHIEAALKIIKGRNAKEVAHRAADLSVRRIANRVGGEVVEEEKE